MLKFISTSGLHLEDSCVCTQNVHPNIDKVLMDAYLLKVLKMVWPLNTMLLLLLFQPLIRARPLFLLEPLNNMLWLLLLLFWFIITGRLLLLPQLFNTALSITLPFPERDNKAPLPIS